MSRRSVFVAIAALALALPAFGQYSTRNANGFEMDNGSDGVVGYFTDPSVGYNVATPGTVNTTPADQLFFTILPKEYMNGVNGVVPQTMELVSMEFDVGHSFIGSASVPSVGTPANIWTFQFTPVTYTNPVTGVSNDRRRYPNLAAAAYLTVVGSQITLPDPGACANGGIWTYGFTYEFGTAVAGTGYALPADGNTDIALVAWLPGGMSLNPPDPSGCEIGGNFTFCSSESTNERVPSGYISVAQNRNPFSGYHYNITANVFNNWNPRTTGLHIWCGFRDPVLQFNYLSNTTVPNPMTGRERGAGALLEDASLASLTVNPGFRTCASGHVADLVVHVLTSDPVTYPLNAAPGIPVAGTYLMLNPADPNFFLLSPLMDVFPGLTNTTEYAFSKDVWDSPAPIGLTGPVAAPGIKFYVQAFVVNVTSLTAISTNVVQGLVY